MSLPRSESMSTLTQPQTPQHILDIMPSSIRFLFENGGPFKVIDNRLAEAKEKLARAIAPTTNEMIAEKSSAVKSVTEFITEKLSAVRKSIATPAPQGLADIFHEAGWQLEACCQKSLFATYGIKNDPAQLLSLFTKKVLTLDTLISAVTLANDAASEALLTEEKTRVRRALVEQFATWNTHATMPDPLDEKIEKLRLQVQYQATQAKQPMECISADSLSSDVRFLFATTENANETPFMLVSTQAGHANSQDTCIQLFNQGIDDFFTGKTETISPNDTIASGWRLISNYHGSGDTVPADIVFFTTLLPELRKLKRKLNALEQLENPPLLSLSTHGNETPRSSPYREAIQALTLSHIKTALPAMLSLMADSVSPVQASIQTVNNRITLLMRTKVAESTAEKLRQETAADQAAMITSAAVDTAEPTRVSSVSTTLFATLPRTLADKPLRMYQDFTEGEPACLYSETGFYDTYRSQLGNDRLPTALADLDTAMNQFEALGADVTTYRYETWDWLVGLMQSGASPDNAVQTCIEGVKQDTASYGQRLVAP